MIGFAILLTGVLPRATGAVWGYFAYSFMIIFFGRMDIFPEFLSYLTPIGFVPQLPLAPGETINILALIILTAVAAVLTAAGFFFYSRRDINAVAH
jgi:ABC-2 type transport system permease protein